MQLSLDFAPVWRAGTIFLAQPKFLGKSGFASK
jgi:hypothetical protein